MKVIFMIRAFGHKVDKSGVRENQLVAPAYETTELCEEAINNIVSKYPNLFYKLEVEEVPLLESIMD